jgi:transcriptional regulator with XRE-family HTH domain
MNYEAAAKELIRALRGKRSQLALSRRLGLKSNVVYRWESGRAWPTAQQLFQLARITARRIAPPLASFAQTLPTLAIETRAGAAAFITALAQPFTVNEVARRVGVSRFVVSRWLAGSSAIRLPELLALVEATTLRVLDFIAIFCDPRDLPSTSSAFQRLSVARSTAYDAPWSHAVLRALELDGYQQLERHRPGWIASRIGISREEEERCLSLLSTSGQIKRQRGRYVVLERKVVDTGVDAERRRALRAFWSNTAVERLKRGDEGVFGFNVFAIAEADIEKLTSLYVDFFGKMRALVDASTPSQRVMLLATQIVGLDAATIARRPSPPSRSSRSRRRRAGSGTPRRPQATRSRA